MAKKKEKEITEVKFKPPYTQLRLRNGLFLTESNLTIARYEKVVSLSESFKKYFTIKLTPKKDEMETEK